MIFSHPRIRTVAWTAFLGLLLVGVGAATLRSWPRAFRWPGAGASSTSYEVAAHADADDPTGHGRSKGDVARHDDSNHAEADRAGTSIALSPSGLKNIGFQPLVIEQSTFIRTLSLPAMVVERPGRSQIRITSPLTGVITKIYPVQGVAVEPGSPMFEVRLTHEELVTAQSNLIRTAQSLDVVNREIERLKSLGEGVIAGKRILEQEYEKQKLEASLRSERQALLLHGLTDDQVESILSEQQLFKTLTVDAPPHVDESENCHVDHLFHVQQLSVTLGQQVEQGQMLCILADHCELFVEGRAFADDAARLREAAREKWSISASSLSADRMDEVHGLSVLYLADQIDPESRAFRFYVALPNEVALDQAGPDGGRFIDWRFKPGQRMELRVPVERWEDRIVVPVEAVIEEGAESYVYRQSGDHFDRRSVTVEYRDQNSVVLANNGAVFPGDVIAARGAYQMHLALKNKSGGGVDPHAGHQH